MKELNEKLTRRRNDLPKGVSGEVFVAALHPLDSDAGYYRGRPVRDGDVVEDKDGRRWRVKVAQVNTPEAFYSPPCDYRSPSVDYWGPQ